MTLVSVHSLGLLGSVGLPGFDGPVHQLLVTQGGRRFRVSVCCRHADAERVLHALAGSEVDYEGTRGALEYLLRRGCSPEGARSWATLPIDPRKPHSLYRIKVPDRRWDLIDLDGWLHDRCSPRDVAERDILSRRHEGRLR
jgi:hypothetical protein